MERRFEDSDRRDPEDRLIDEPDSFFELGLWAAYKMYPEWGDVPAGGVVVGIAPVQGKPCMIVATKYARKAA